MNERPLCKCGKNPAFVWFVGEFICGECYVKINKKIQDKQKQMLEEIWNDAENTNN